MIGKPMEQMLHEENERQKPIKAKPVFYACCYEPLKAIAQDMGYNLLINGSLNRDMDLVAIPWCDKYAPMKDVVVAFDKYLRGIQYSEESVDSGYMHSVLPGGRHSFVINLNRGGRWNQYLDEQWYLDISFTPFGNDQLNEEVILNYGRQIVEQGDAIKQLQEENDIFKKREKLIEEKLNELGEKSGFEQAIEIVHLTTKLDDLQEENKRLLADKWDELKDVDEITNRIFAERDALREENERLKKQHEVTHNWRDDFQSSTASATIKVLELLKEKDSVCAQLQAKEVESKSLIAAINRLNVAVDWYWNCQPSEKMDGEKRICEVQKDTAQLLVAVVGK